jgi:hypothetical protein
MISILKTKPRSTAKIELNISYEEILKAIAEGNTNRFLRGIVSTCKAHPETVMFVVYKTGETRVVLVYGTIPTAIIVDGNRVKDILQPTAEEGCIYVWCHSL